MERLPAAVLLDWDGVITDSLDIYIEFYREVCRRYGKQVPFNNVGEFKEWYEPRWELNFYELGFSPQEYAQILELAEEIIDYTDAPFFENIDQTLARLAMDWPLAIVSTCPKHLITERLAQNNLLEYFSLIIGSDDGSTEKKNRIMHALTQLNLHRGVMVGDTDLDIEAAKANEIDSIGVSYGWSSRRRLEAASPTVIIDTPLQLEATVREILAGYYPDTVAG